LDREDPYDRGSRWGPSRYSAEFRADAVALARSSDRPLAQVTRDLGVNHETLRQWVKAAERAEELKSPQK